MKTTYKFIRFEPGEFAPWRIINIKSGAQLGVIDWEPTWGKWIMISKEAVIWSAGCLRDVAHFIDQLPEPEFSDPVV